MSTKKKKKKKTSQTCYKSTPNLARSLLSPKLQGERGGSVVECRTPEREVRGSRPTAAVLCPWARHFTPRKYWLITQEAMAPSRHDWKIVDWDVKPQHNQPTNPNCKWACAWQNQQNDLCAQRKPRSVGSSAQSDQSLGCPHEESLGLLVTDKAPSEDSDQTGWMQGWFESSLGAQTLIRLGGCPGWFKSSLGAQLLCWFCRAATQSKRFYNTIISTRPPTLWCQF